MPGMMDTILDLGLNAVTTAGLASASGDDGFAASCRDRFVTMFRDIVGVETVPDDPWLQLRAAIESVFRSWNGDRARAYRAREHISDDLGTAVTVQAMVFGNRGPDSASGVLFTRNPATGEPTLYGDILFNAQGEDVVAGTHRTEPIAVLDERLPAVAAELRGAARVLEHHFADLCDIEFTIERGRLWLLQVRVGKRSPLAALRIAVDMAEEPGFPVTRAEAVERVAAYLADPPRVSLGRPAGLHPLTIGLPASPGVASGEVVTSPDAAEAAAAAGRSVILVRFETSPDDVRGMAAAKGVLTARGGLASHAAVVARGWGIPAVVGAPALAVADGSIEVGGERIDVGQPISIDGTTGEVFAGIVDGASAPVPEAATLRGWAAELGIEIPAEGGPGRTAETVSEGAATGAPSAPAALPPTGSPAGGPTLDDIVWTLAIKGLSLPDAVAAASLSSVEAVGPLVDRLVAEGLAERLAGAARLTESGKARAAELLAADQDRWVLAMANAALDGFVAFDGRMKETVTAWQMKDASAQPVLNDHTDAAYDAGVLERLAALHRDATAWLATLPDGLPRLITYRARLDRALAAARDGDGRFVASPRVDSYHSVWFELHEDLIRLAGRDRASEVAAGRA
jgi:pyruvate,orthophosphate dikinase